MVGFFFEKCHLTFSFHTLFPAIVRARPQLHAPVVLRPALL
jgi:hypothetical protein